MISTFQSAEVISQSSDLCREQVRLFDHRCIDRFSWPDTEDGQYAKQYLLPLLQKGSHHYIDNAKTTLMVLSIDDVVLPISINDAYDESQGECNSYVCSLYAHYVSYALEYFSQIPQKSIRRALTSVLKGMRKILPLHQLDQAVTVNNWFFSTNLYPKLTESQVVAITQHLQKAFPHHAIVFRSIDTYGSADLYHILKKQQFGLISNRIAYFLNTRNKEALNSRAFKSDLKLLRESDYEIIEHKDISPQELPRITSLYRNLYLCKHTDLNPQFNFNFMELALNNQALNLLALRKDGVIDAVVGYCKRNGVLFSPMVGYDMAKPQNTKLYRLASTILILEAAKHHLVFHLSSSAAFYKKVRKAESIMEYTAVYHKHLPFTKRLIWWILTSLTNTLWKPFMLYEDRNVLNQ